MAAPQALPTRLIGALFVERGLVSESQIRVALEIQHETGQQLGQILVERFGVSRKELASVVAEQWAKLGGSAGPDDAASWRRLGEIFVERGFVTQEELDEALARQRQTGERLGEALVALGVISKFELAGALAEQMAVLGETGRDSDGPVDHATVHQLPARDEALDPTAATPDNVVELTQPPGPSDETPSIPAAEVAAFEEPSAAPTAMNELEPEAVEPEAPELAAHDPARAETPVSDALEPEPVDSETFEVAAFEVPETERAPEDAGLPWAQLTRIDASEAAAPEDAEPTGAELPWLRPAESSAPDEPAREISEVGGAELPWLQPADAEADAVSEGIDEAAAGMSWSQPAEAAGSDTSAEIVGLSSDEPTEVGAAEAAVFATREDLAEARHVEERVEHAELGEPELADGLLTDLHDALPVDVQPDDCHAGEVEPMVSCIAFAPTTEGYRMVALEALPEPGETIDVPEVGERLVLRVGRSPIPGDTRRCAYVEEPVTVPVGVAVH